jgi:hypothetical protein
VSRTHDYENFEGMDDGWWAMGVIVTPSPHLPSPIPGDHG